MPKNLPLLLLPALLAGCASMERSGPPAPVVEAQTPSAEAPAPEPEPIAEPEEPAPAPTQVYAYTPPEEIRETEPSAEAEPAGEPQPRAQATPPVAETRRQPAADEAQSGRSAASEPKKQPEPQPPPQRTAQQEAQQPDSGEAAAEPAAPPAPEVASAEPQRSGLTPSGLPPAVAALAERAEQQRQSGDQAGAAATLERALRIQPQEAYLWNRLAQVRLQQGLNDSASKLATRSNTLSGDRPALKRNNWEIIANAKRQGGDLEGAREAERKAAGG